MSFTPPEYLKNDPPTFDELFESGEVIYRRHAIRVKVPLGDYFTYIKTSDFLDGVSVNRSKYCKDPADALWAINGDGSNCSYELKNGEVVYCLITELIGPGNKTGITLYCKHTPFVCNSSHTDLLCQPDLVIADIETKQKVINLKLFLNTIFKTTGIVNNS